jgi:CRISPR-associated protein Cas1
MSIVYITEQRSKVSKRGERMIVSKNGKVIEEIAVGTVEQVHIMGRGIHVTTPALIMLAQHNVELVYLTQNGRFQAAVNGPLHKHGQLRLKQARLGERVALSIAKQIVRGKLANQRALLQLLQAANPDEALNGIKGIELMARRIGSVTDRETLLGLEGQGAVVYWRGFRALLKGEWGFDRRAYYPPPDPINALLSFGYTLLANDVRAAVRTIGLDPYLGVFHVVDYGRPSLALDMMEEWRPIIVDAMVLGLVNQGVIQPHEFKLVSNGYHKSPGVYLVDEARKRFLRAYALRVNELAVYPPTGKKEKFRRMFHLQAQALARSVLSGGKVTYQAYVG